MNVRVRFSLAFIALAFTLFIFACSDDGGSDNKPISGASGTLDGAWQDPYGGFVLEFSGTTYIMKGGDMGEMEFKGTLGYNDSKINLVVTHVGSQENWFPASEAKISQTIKANYTINSDGTVLTLTDVNTITTVNGQTKEENEGLITLIKIEEG
jgi:hypothetical protein